MKVFSEILGKYVEIPDNPRIVSLAPSITDTLLQLNAWDNVVGISIYCEVPEGYEDKPRVGAYLKVMYSRLNKLRPDLILLTTGAQRGVLEELIDRGYTVYPTPLPVSIDGILENLYVIGNLIGRRRLALERIKYYHRIISSISREPYLSVYYEVDLGEPITIGGPSYISSGLYTIGMVNIFIEKDRPYFNPDFNEIRETNPDLIIYEKRKNAKTDINKLVELFEKRGWKNMVAVKKKKIIILDENTLAHYGPKFIDNMLYLDKKVKELY